jgi:hypothetical protein
VALPRRPLQEVSQADLLKDRLKTGYVDWVLKFHCCKQLATQGIQ